MVLHANVLHASPLGHSMKTKDTLTKQKANITLKLDRDLIREIRILAAEEDTSISALLAVHLQEIVKKRSGYDEAKKRAIARMRKGYDLGFSPPRSRDELYER
jgi:hypothetical protein